MNWKLAYAPNFKCKGKEYTTISELENSGFDIIPASVPGNFELDLIREGKLEDLYYSTNTLKAQELENMHVWYFCRFTAESNQYIRFEGIDTVADIYINGRPKKSVDNMFMACEVDAAQGENELVVHIKPAMIEARKFVPPALSGALTYGYPTLYLRKAAHMFGWDIMPRIVSAGLWKEVKLLSHKKDRICEVFFATNKIENGTAYVRFYLNAELSGDFAQDYTVKIEGKCGESHFVREKKLWHNTNSFVIQIPNCRPWFPKNAGDANLYETKVSLLYKGELCDDYCLKVGIRTVELDRTDYTDKDGNGEFCFKINGKKVFMLGTNWVPLDAFHSNDSNRLGKALELLDDIGCNTVRCWGGSVYESDEFYNFCDEHGIMVWQDFAMSCAVYPQEQKFADILAAEAEYQVKRLRNHASVVLWAGDNECDLMYKNWVGNNLNPNNNFLTREVLKRVCETHDYSRPYLPSSPYVSDDVMQGKGIMPEQHLWGPRDYFKGDYYKNTFCHFASETGYHGFPSPKSLEKFLKNPQKIFEADGTPTSEYLVHAASPETNPSADYAYRIKLAYDQVITLFGSCEDNFDDFVRQSQISQAEAKKYFIEKFRVNKWKCTGIIWWNLLDGWPQISDAVVDYYFTKKLAYYYIRRSQEPVCLMFAEPENGILPLFGVNDTKEKAELSYKVTRLSDGKTLLSGKAILEPDSALKIATLEADNEKEFYLIEWEKDGKKYMNHYFTNIIDIDYEKYIEAVKKCNMYEFEGF